MKTEKEMLEEEAVSDETVDEGEDIADEVTADTDEDEFEYDDSGNIIVPDVDFSSDNADLDEEIGIEDLEGLEDDDVIPDPRTRKDKKDDTKDDTNTASGDSDSTEDDKPEADAKAPDSKYAALETLVKEALKKNGYDTSDIEKALSQMASDSDENDPGKEKTDTPKDTSQIEFDRIKQSDLAEIHAAYPETQKYKTIDEMPNFNEFGTYRDKGVPAVKAFIAANPDIVKSGVANSVKQQSLNDTKNHLRTRVPNSSGKSAQGMTYRELKEWREMFPGYTDKQIIKIYNESKE